LATSADFVGVALRQKGRTFASLEDLRRRAVEMERAISESGRGGIADTQSVSEIAAWCAALLGYLK
jgi:hypothetical protein